MLLPGAGIVKIGAVLGAIGLVLVVGMMMFVSVFSVQMAGSAQGSNPCPLVLPAAGAPTSMPGGICGGNSAVAQAALAIAQHLHGDPDVNYDAGVPQAVLTYWAQACPAGSNCFPDWQNGNLQCVLLVTGAYALAGVPLPAAGNAIDFWSLYASRPGWIEVPSATAPAAQRGLPVPGDIMVWWNAPPKLGHVAIVTAVVPPANGKSGSVTFAESNGPGALVTEPLLPDLSVQTWAGYSVYGYIRSLAIVGANASAHLVRISQLDPAQYGPPSPSEFNTWAYSACSAASMTEVFDAYGHTYRITDILKVEAQLGEITPQLGLLEDAGIGRTAASFGFNTTWGHNLSLDQIIAIASAGAPVIVSFPPDRYAGGHLLVVRGGDANTVLVADSSSWNRTSIPRAQFMAWWIGAGETFGFSAIVTPKSAAMQIPSSQYVSLAQQDAKAAGIDPQTFVRQINAESGFNPNAVSPAGAEGIAQFLPSTASGLGVNPFDPVASLSAAATLMAGYARGYNGDYAMALGAYNSGTGTVASAVKTCGAAQWLTCMPAETQHYIHLITGV